MGKNLDAKHSGQGAKASFVETIKNVKQLEQIMVQVNPDFCLERFWEAVHDLKVIKVALFYN